MLELETPPTEEAAEATEEVAPAEELVTLADTSESAVVDTTVDEIEVRDIELREIGALIAPWDTVVDTPIGLESFRRGAFAHVNPAKVVLKLGHKGPMVGRGVSIEERDKGAYMVFRVSKTLSGDEALTLAKDGVTPHVSIEYNPRTSTAVAGHRAGRRQVELTRVGLTAVATTPVPYYEAASVDYVRSREEETFVPDPQETPAVEPVDLGPITSQITALGTSIDARFAAFNTALEERSRSNFSVPNGEIEEDPRAKRGDWMGVVIRMLAGERPPETQMRDLADLITSDNVGVVPDAFSTELIGVVDPSRPFLNSTRKLDLPPAGMSLVVPKIVTRPTAGVQAVYGDESQPEKSDIASTATSITNVSFDAVTIAGGGDISLQLLKRSSPSYLSLYLELLAEAYGQNAEDEALDSLISTIGSGGVNNGGTLNPSDLELGTAWGFGAAVRKPINTMWMSSAAVSAFIDAKATTTNAPLYSNIQAGFTAGGGTGGTISGLRPIYVPALDATAIDVLVGPSSGFGWTEDGTYTLQVDVPAKAGRDVALVGILWFAPMYPTAFTAYAIGS